MEEHPANPIIAPIQTPAPDNSGKKSSRPVVLISLIILIIILIVGYKFVKKPGNYQATNNPVPVNQKTVTVTTVPPATPSGTVVVKIDSSDQQLDKDLQGIQGNLNQLNSDQNNSNQAIQNQSQDTQQ